jgi:transcriptional regulator, propionate catabolism operon regulatory protein
MTSKICFISPSPESTVLYNATLGRLSEPPLILEGALTAAETAARVAHERGCEIFVTPEANARNLWGKITAPIVAIPLTALDIAQALNRAKTEYGEPLAYLEFQHHYVHLSALQAMLKCEIREFVFQDREEGLVKLQQAIQEGCRAVVGGAIVASVAREMEVPCVPLLPKPEDILEAFRQAEQIASVRQIEQREAMKFRYVVQYSFTGVIVADEENKITIFNSAAERIFGIQAGQALGRRLDEVVPQNQLLSVEEKEHRQLEELKTIRQKQLMVNRIPIVEERRIIGTIFTFQEVSNIQSLEEKIRRASHEKGLTAKMRFQGVVGDSKAIRETIFRAQRFAATDETVLITGESGTGKEIFAQSIHNASARHAQPFVAVSCAAIPPTLLESELFGYADGAFTGARRGGKQGYFELAHRGTIFLDEVGELSREAQGHLLRVLQEKEVMRVGDGKVTPVDVRVIAATNQPLEEALQKNLFRWDLYHRLNVLRLRLPPVREHPEDVLKLASAFVDQYCSNQQLASQVKEALRKYESLLIRHSWPGNVRELQNLMKRIVALVETMKGDSLEQEMKDLFEETFRETPNLSAFAKAQRRGGLRGALAELERELILQEYEESRLSKKELARRLGIGRTTLWRKLNET